MGYRMQLLEVSWPAEVAAGSAMDVGYMWRNAGVAPCLPGGFPAITLKDPKGGIAGVFVDENLDMRELPVGPPGKSQPVGREAIGTSQWYEEHNAFHVTGVRAKGVSPSSRPLVSFALPPAHILKPGSYSLHISVGTRTGSPRIALPLPDEDGSRRYRLGSIIVR
jgi:hypothetical protein